MHLALLQLLSYCWHALQQLLCCKVHCKSIQPNGRYNVANKPAVLHISEGALHARAPSCQNPTLYLHAGARPDRSKRSGRHRPQPPNAIPQIILLGRSSGRGRHSAGIVIKFVAIIYAVEELAAWHTRTQLYARQERAAELAVEGVCLRAAMRAIPGG